MSAQSDGMGATEVQPLHLRIVPANVCEGPPKTDACNYAATDGARRRRLVKVPLNDPSAVTPELEEYGRNGDEVLHVLSARPGEVEEVLRDLLR
ncbi:hypothetical protein [Streptomyces sp. NPDC059819]|uniref:hypothetical protein n=1 Tax=Streptomyces sp. NPDC059819 TaxID=3346963 RepID=UPI003654D34D